MRQDRVRRNEHTARISTYAYVCVYRPVRLKARVEGIRQAQRKCLRSGTGASFVSLIGYGAGLEERPNISWPFRDCVNNF